jgi:hypothetical protein
LSGSKGHSFTHNAVLGLAAIIRPTSTMKPTCRSLGLKQIHLLWLLLCIADSPVPASISATAAENGPAVSFTVRWTDIDADELHTVQMGSPTKGTVTSSGETWSYTPNADTWVLLLHVIHSFALRPGACPGAAAAELKVLLLQSTVAGDVAHAAERCRYLHLLQTSAA